MERTDQDASPAEMKLHRADGRYYVELDGIKVGWVLRSSGPDRWIGYTSTREWHTGEKVTSGNHTRRDALMELVSNLEIHHQGWVVRLNMDTIEDEWQQVEPGRLRALWNYLLDQKYPDVHPVVAS